jgi:hypothetical protein
MFVAADSRPRGEAGGAHKPPLAIPGNLRYHQDGVDS